MPQPKGPATPQSKNSMELAMERAGVVTPPDSIQKVVELRNVKDIARAVRYAMGELQAHLDLGTADTASKKLLIEAMADVVTDIDLAKTNSEIAASIDAVLKTMSDLDQASADLLSGAEAQIAELATELEGMSSGVGSTIPNAALSVIDAELDRRGKASDSVGAIQEQLEDEKADMDAQLTTLKQRIQAGDVSQATKTKKREFEN